MQRLMLERAKAIDGWMSNSELEWLARMAKGKTVIIEFGCYMGRSTRALADNSSGLVFAVDPWTDEYFDKDGKKAKILRTDSYEQFKANLADVIRSGQVEMIRCKSSEFPMIEEGIADFVFIDGDHRYEEVKKDILIAQKLVRFGGVIAGHDYTYVSDWPGVKQAVDEFYPDVNQCDSIWWIIKT